MPALFLLLASWLAAQHGLFEEWDGCAQVFGAQEIAQGMGYTGWASHYWPPLFTLLLLLLSKGMTYFVAGKVISVVSGALLLAIIFPLAMELSRSRTVALASQLLLATNQLFLNTSIQNENHTLATMLFALAMLLALIALRRQTLSWVLAWGAAAGLAAMARYTNLILAPAGLVLILMLVHDRRRFAYALVFLTIFIAIGSPWYYLNHVNNGSPLANWHYENIGREVIGRAWGITPAEFWWSAQSQFHNVRDIFLASPRDYCLNVLSKLKETLSLIPTFTGLVGVVGLAGVLALPRLIDRRCWLTLWVTAAMYVGLTCQAFVYGVVMMPYLPFVALAAMLLLRALAHRLRRQKPHVPVMALAGVVLALLLVADVNVSCRNLTRYLKDTDDGGQMVAAQQVTQALKRDPQIAHKHVMALNPCRAYYSGSGYLLLPTYLQSDDPTTLVTYRGVPPEARQWALRYPFRPMVDRADYLIFDRAAKVSLPQFAYLLDRDTARVPRNWRPVYAAPGIAVWAIRW